MSWAAPLLPGSAFLAEDTKTPGTSLKPEDLIQNRFKHDLNEGAITVQVTPLFNGHYAVKLSGELATDAKVATAKAAGAATVAAINAEKPGTILLGDEKKHIKSDYDDSGIIPAKPKDTQQETMSNITKSISSYLTGSDVTVSVRPFITTGAIGKNQFEVVLSGTVPSEAEQKTTVHTVAAAIRRLNNAFKATGDESKKMTITGNKAKKSEPPADVKQNEIISDFNIKDLIVDPSSEIKKRFERELKQQGATVTVYRKDVAVGLQTPDRYVVAISGTADNLLQRQSIRATAEKIKNRILDPKNSSEKIKGVALEIDRSRLTVTGKDVTDEWTIRYLGGIGSADVSNSLFIAQLVDSLNATYGTKDNPVVTRDGSSLRLRGNDSTVRRIKADLALLDVAQPQVQMDFLAIQISGDADEVNTKARLIRPEIDKVKGELIAFGPLLRQTLQEASNDPSLQKDLYKELKENTAFKRVYARLYPERYQSFLKSDNQLNPGPDVTDYKPLINALTLSFTPDEALILMGVSKDRYEFVDKMEDIWTKARFKNRLLWQDWPEWQVVMDWNTPPTSAPAKFPDVFPFVSPNNKDASTSARFQTWLNSNPIAMWQPAKIYRYPGFRNLRAAFNKEHLRDDQEGVIELLNAADNYGAMIRALGVKGDPQGSKLNGQDQDPADVLLVTADAPEALSQHSAPVEAMLKNLVEAVQADVKALYLTPFKDKIRAINGGKDSEGISLVGDTHMVVTTRQKASLTPSLVSSVETTRPAPFGQDLLDAIAPSGAGGKKTEEKSETDASGVTTTTRTTTDSSDSTGLSGLSKLVAGLPTGQAALVAGALLSEVPPTYQTVSPGIGITIRPSMTPDGGTADLTLESNFGVTTEALGSDTSRKDVWARGVPSAVQSHKLVTQAYVSGFDLFDISSFTVETSTPQAESYFFVLGRLPLIGQLFRWPHGNKKVQHQSIVLVSAALLPSSLGLIKLYGPSGYSTTESPVDNETKYIKPNTNALFQ